MDAELLHAAANVVVGLLVVLDVGRLAELRLLLRLLLLLLLRLLFDPLHLVPAPFRSLPIGRRRRRRRRRRLLLIGGGRVRRRLLIGWWSRRGFPLDQTAGEDLLIGRRSRRHLVVAGRDRKRLRIGVGDGRRRRLDRIGDGADGAERLLARRHAGGSVRFGLACSSSMISHK